jgi:hypothetical protein
VDAPFIDPILLLHLLRLCFESRVATSGSPAEDNVVLASGKIAPVARLGCYDYTAVREFFEMRIPNSRRRPLDWKEGPSDSHQPRLKLFTA